MTPDRKVFWGIGIPENLGGLNHNQIFGQLPYLNDDAIVPLVKELQINCLVIESDKMPDYKEVLVDDSLLFEKIHSENNFILFKVCTKS